MHVPAHSLLALFICRCKSTEFNPHGQLFFNPLVQAMRMIVHFGETLPEDITPEHIISSALLFIWALSIFIGMLFCFGIGAATGEWLCCAAFSPSLACCFPLALVQPHVGACAVLHSAFC